MHSPCHTSSVGRCPLGTASRQGKQRRSRPPGQTQGVASRPAERAGPAAHATSGISRAAQGNCYPRQVFPQIASLGRTGSITSRDATHTPTSSGPEGWASAQVTGTPSSGVSPSTSRANQRTLAQPSWGGAPTAGVGVGEPRVHQVQPLPLASPAPGWASGPPAPFLLGHVWVVCSWTRGQTLGPSAGSLNPWTSRKSQAPLQTFPGGQATLPPSTGSMTPRRQFPPIRDLRGQAFFARSTFRPTCCRTNFCFPETLMAMMLDPINIQGEGS